MKGPPLEARFRAVSIVWAAMLAGVTLFAAVVWGLAGGLLAPGFSASLAPGPASKLLILAPVLLAAGIAYRNGEVGRRVDADSRLAAWQARITVASALQEGGGICGLAISLLAARPSWALGVWAVTVVAMVLSRPRRQELDRLLR